MFIDNLLFQNFYLKIKLLSLVDVYKVKANFISIVLLFLSLSKITSNNF